MDKGAERCHMYRGGLVEPDVAIDACTLVEPTFFQGGIGTDAHQVVAAVVQVFADVIHLRGIAAGLAAQVEAVDPHAGIAEDAVELQIDVLAQVFLRHGEGLAVPADAGLGIFITDGLVAVAVAGFAGKGEVHHPVVGQVYRLPCRSIKFLGVRPGVVDGRRLGEVIEILGSAAEVFLR